MYEWANEMNCAVTVCDTKGIILYMNALVSTKNFLVTSRLKIK